MLCLDRQTELQTRGRRRRRRRRRRRKHNQNKASGGGEGFGAFNKLWWWNMVGALATTSWNFEECFVCFLIICEGRTGTGNVVMVSKVMFFLRQDLISFFICSFFGF
ncbi:hypothetical protein RchiOBHm_Chr4g0405331 [Rosa chinensis]|uniref:Uncharacterized protein n=1 Tax=Rosa chinensis TaxID=74649 RepID=A0A2P6QU14_ROSCH|nr:hypothetical protein RchiOBHm_Chr4g0405331 [Rosa chinensis]